MWLVRGPRDIKSQGSRDVPPCVGGIQENQPVGRGLARLDGSSSLSLPPTLRRLQCHNSPGTLRKAPSRIPRRRPSSPGNILSTKFRLQGTLGDKGRHTAPGQHWPSTEYHMGLAQVVTSVR